MELFERYLAEIEKLNTSCRVVKGVGHQRVIKSQEALSGINF